MTRIFFIALLFFLPLNLTANPYTITLSEQQTYTLANLIWQNEGNGQIKHLTVWNRNENFPSLGIGHFIWYPTAEKGPYIEQFPQLIAYLIDNNVSVPSWLADSAVAPWKTRESFYEAFNDPQLTEIRELMQKTVALQAMFVIKRLEQGIPDILASSDTNQKKKINKSLNALTSTPEGIFVLLDYVNFKGEGISNKERYQGVGWGLKQVLLSMPEDTDNAILSFALSADEVLTRRVKNAPKDEFNWLKGWRARVYKYPLLNINE